MIKTKIEYIINALEHVREKPKLFIGVDLDGIGHFLNGFDLATGILDLDLQTTYKKFFTEVLSEKGLGLSSSLQTELRERGLDKSQIIYELINMRIEAWKRLLGGISEG